MESRFFSWAMSLAWAMTIDALAVGASRESETMAFAMARGRSMGVGALAFFVGVFAWNVGCTVRFEQPSGTSDAGTNSDGQVSQDAAPGCGDGILQTGEVCDGTDLGGQTCQTAAGYESGELLCRDTCQLDLSDCHTCGDGHLQGPETCDDENLGAGDGCDADCKAEPGWVCQGEPSRCVESCGNGQLDSGEACDDENLAFDDGCTPNCQIEHGWICDGEPSQCHTLCGDGLVAGDEACDDGNTGEGDGCSGACQVEHGWSCDGEPSICETTCGDGVRAATEDCDDGNLTSGDGCSAQCQHEDGWACQGEPSLCDTVCGDGVIVGNEDCDDGNRHGGDGCLSSCHVQDYFTCDGQPSHCVCVVFVDVHSSSPSSSGASWQDAYREVQDGVDRVANMMSSTCSVWVAGGTYNWSGGLTSGTLSIQQEGMSVYGGFAGTETALSQRNLGSHPTILDMTGGSQSVVHVQFANNVVLDGLTMTGADVSTTSGGGLWATNSSITVSNCTFSGNQAKEGGGAYLSNTDATFDNCVFSGNTATDDSGGGLDVRNHDSYTVQLTHCEFTSNQAQSGGGGAAYFDHGVVRIEDCSIQGNWSYASGGGLYFHYVHSGSEVSRCFLIDNSTDPGNQQGRGGGLRAVSSEVLVHDSVLAGNQSCDGSAAYTDNGGVSFINDTIVSNRFGQSCSSTSQATLDLRSNDVVKNCIFWDNDPGTSMIDGTQNVTYSLNAYPFGGSGNITGDPFFVAPQGGDYHLASNSPGIDSGSGDGASTSDMDGHSRYDAPNIANTGSGNPNYVDMGAYEYHP